MTSFPPQIRDHVGTLYSPARNLKLSQIFKHSCVSKLCYFEAWEQLAIIPSNSKFNNKTLGIFLGHPVFVLSNFVNQMQGSKDKTCYSKFIGLETFLLLEKTKKTIDGRLHSLQS